MAADASDPQLQASSSSSSMEASKDQTTPRCRAAGGHTAARRL